MKKPLKTAAVAAAALLLAVLAVPSCRQPAQPPEEPVARASQAMVSQDFPYCQDAGCSWGGISFDPADIQAAYDQWKQDHITYPSQQGFDPGCADCLKVWKSDDTAGIGQTTTSESSAYGMLLSLYFGDQDQFRQIWNYVKAHSRNGHIGLQQWCLNSSNQQCVSAGSATDATVDIALALVGACNKGWTGSYCAEAQTVLDNMWDYEINSGSDSLVGPWPTPGDNWGGDTLNPSYFSPGHWEAFNQFEGGSRWTEVAAKASQNIDLNQSVHGGCSRLVYNWTNPSGNAGGGGDATLYSWDAIRIPWRQALGHKWYGDAEAGETLSEIGGFFRWADLAAPLTPLGMDGTGGCCEGSAGPAGLAALSVIAADSYAAQPAGCGAASLGTPNTRQAAYDAALATVNPSATYPANGYSYYNNYWRLVSLMAVTGNFPNPMDWASPPTCGDSSCAPSEDCSSCPADCGACGSSSAACAFSGGSLCQGWAQASSGDTHDWTLRSGGTPSSGTGPSGADSDSHYAYLETSAGAANSAGNSAILESPAVQGSPDLVLTFKYHMYGADMGTLNVDVHDGSWHQAVWSRTGQQQGSSGAAWGSATVALGPYSGSVRVRFRGVAAGGYRGDMAVDTVSIAAGSGPSCGDSSCSGGETCSSCPADCGACPPACGNSSCEAGETCASCPADCGACPPVCGNSSCEAGETCTSCPSDCGPCPPVCGNSTCEAGETCSSCPADCGACGGGAPCDGLCQNPVTFTSRSYHTGSIGTGSTCRQYVGDLGGANFGNFVAPRTLSVNGVNKGSAGGNISLPPKVNGGYCFSVTAGNWPWAYFVTW